MDLPWKTGKEYYELHSKAMFSRYPFYHATMVGSTKEEFKEYVFERLRLKSGDRVVDLGCGSGYITSEISKVCECTGISNSEACIEQCRINYPEAKFELGEMQTYKKPGATHFIAMESIGYSEIPLTLNNVYENLKPGGMFYVKDIFYYFNESSKQKENRLHWENYFMYKTDTVPNFVKLAYEAGFEVLSYTDISEKVNFSMFLDSLQYNLVEFNYPHPEIYCHVAAEFILWKRN